MRNYVCNILWQHMNKALIHKWNQRNSKWWHFIIDSLENTSEMNDLDRVFQIEGRVYIKILGHIIMWGNRLPFLEGMIWLQKFNSCLKITRFLATNVLKLEELYLWRQEEHWGGSILLLCLFLPDIFQLVCNALQEVHE